MNPPEEYEDAEERVKLAKVYLFAMYIGDPGAMDMVTEALLQSIWELRGGRQWFPPHPDLVDIIWEGTARKSHMRQMILDIFAHAVNNECRWRIYPKKFLADLVKQLWECNRRGDCERVLLHGDSVKNYFEERDESQGEGENEEEEEEDASC
jgi:hypothetical protein